MVFARQTYAEKLDRRRGNGLVRIRLYNERFKGLLDPHKLADYVRRNG